MSRFGEWIRPRLRLWAIYNELGYIPWRKPRAAKKSQDGIFKGTGEAMIPFLNDDAKRTFSHLFLRPGYMIRDYTQRGQHERYLAPFTALLVFYSVFTLLTAVVQPGSVKKGFGDGILDALDGESLEVDLNLNGNTVQVDSTDLTEHQDKVIRSLVSTTAKAIVFTHLNLYPQAADTPWKESLAAVEGDLRSKGIPLFLGNFFLLWIAMTWLLRKKYGIRASGAAAASAYVLCQFCLFMFLALLLSFGQDAKLGILLTAVLVFIDYRQWLKVDNRTAFWLTVKTGILNVLFRAAFFLILGLVLVGIAYART